MRPLTATLLTGLISTPAFAADMVLKVTIPRLSVAEYHRPYVAVWIEHPDRRVAANLAVWYDLDLKNGGGTKWLKDLRQWWRRSGRTLRMPVDGVTSVTRPPGEHELSFSGGSAPLAALPPGEYRLVVEAAREVGGREILSVSFSWPPASAGRLKAAGAHDLGPVVVDLKP